MKIYIATSWKNEKEAKQLAADLRGDGHEVDCFCDPSTGRYVFHYIELGPPENYDAISFLANEQARRAFDEDKKHIDWADAVILLLPCGRSAHLEAGYAKGKGKLLFITHIGDFPQGEFDVMYGFADHIASIEKTKNVVNHLKSVGFITHNKTAEDTTISNTSFKDLADEIATLVEQKQAAYGDSFGKSGAVLRQLYPSGIKPEQYDDMLAVVRIIDKLFRIATDRDALGESPWRDVTGYGLLATKRQERSGA